MDHQIHIIGSSGFLGRALQRCHCDGDLILWSHQGKDQRNANYFDLSNVNSWQNLCDFKPKNVILLSWPGLPNYDNEFHLTENLPQSIRLINHLILAGCESITVAGTCYEYGLKSGALKEAELTEPVNLYGIAKDTLRRFTACQCAAAGVNWTWTRIFYPYGEGQNPKSLYPSLLRAINQNNLSFPMGSGKQIRDFIPVDNLAKCMLRLACSGASHGVVNLGSGNPKSIRNFVEDIIEASSSSLQLQLGVYPDRINEPEAFWADTSKLDSLLAT